MISSDTVLNTVIQETQGVVVSGPFTGMKIDPNEDSYGSGIVLGQGLITKLLGFMEQQLHPHIEKMIASSPSQIVNVGCGEGYYAVGLALRVPEANIIAVDDDGTAINLTRNNARLNDVSHRFYFVRQSPETPQQQKNSQIAKSKLKANGMWIVDIEGAEESLLDLDNIPLLKTCSIIVEVHSFRDRSILNKIVSRFSESHSIDIVESAGRNPDESEILRKMPDDIKWPIMSEGRPEAMQWLAMYPKSL